MSDHDHIAIDIKEDPPAFTPYQAEFFETDDGDIISHDHHLNEDGEALYRFLLAHSATIPKLFLSCSGSHSERRTRLVTKTINGQTTSHQETYYVNVTDFHFSIDVSQNIIPDPVHWSFADSEPAYRGLMVRQVQSDKSRSKPTVEDVTDHKIWWDQIRNDGLPPWTGRDKKTLFRPEQSSQTLREWADEYTASPKLLKELTYTKVVYGWDVNNITEAVKQTIKSTFYTGTVHVNFSLTDSKIHIRPDRKLSRILSDRFYKFLLWLFLIYPFIWLFKRYHSRGGGRWEVYGGAYALKVVEPLLAEEERNLPVVQDASAVDVNDPAPTKYSRIVTTPEGPMKVTGVREGEWFKHWEPVIKRCVLSRYTSGDALVDVRDGPVDPARALDGFTPELDGFRA